MNHHDKGGERIGPLASAQKLELLLCILEDWNLVNRRHSLDNHVKRFALRYQRLVPPADDEGFRGMHAPIHKPFPS